MYVRSTAARRTLRGRRQGRRIFAAPPSPIWWHVLLFGAMMAAALMAFGFAAPDCGAAAEGLSQSRGRLETLARSFKYSEKEDLQLPELPTGCEATAISTLLRLHGVPVTKIAVAEAMPRSDGDFVNAFWGNPYAEDGGFCLAPCAAATANSFLSESCVVATRGERLGDLPLPACVWITEGLVEPVAAHTQGSYTAFFDTHCVTVVFLDDQSVHVIDPLLGPTVYPRERFETIYEETGGQVVYFKEL